MAGITEDELLQFFKAIEEGTIVLRAEYEPQDVYAGNVPYAASNGWRITIFNDCNEWDYVDEVVTADGRSVDFDSTICPARGNMCLTARRHGAGMASRDIVCSGAQAAGPPWSTSFENHLFGASGAKRRQRKADSQGRAGGPGYS